MKRYAAVLICTLMASSPALAIGKLYAPYVDAGEWELEYFTTKSIDNNHSKDDDQQHQFSIGYGVTPYWKTELYTAFVKEPNDSMTFHNWEWENIFQLTKPGEYWMDVGASLAYEWTPQSNHADALEGRLLLAKEIGPTFHILNLILEKEVGSGPREQLEGGFIWSSRYNYSPYFQPGFEINSEFGELSHTGSFDHQHHYLGPVFYGHIPLNFAEHDGDEEGLGYRIGYLFGVSDNASDGQLVLQLEYGLEF